jgi:hypothetical protein
MSIDKMRGNKGSFGRCTVQGHGCNCEVSDEIQSKSITRAKEKEQWLKEAIDEINKMSTEEFEQYLIKCDKTKDKY